MSGRWLHGLYYLADKHTPPIFFSPATASVVFILPCHLTLEIHAFLVHLPRWSSSSARARLLASIASGRGGVGGALAF